MTILELVILYINIYMIDLYFSVWKNIFNHKNILLYFKTQS